VITNENVGEIKTEIFANLSENYLHKYIRWKSTADASSEV